MKYNTFEEKGYKGGSITRTTERVLYCRITVDIHSTHCVAQEALEHIYTDAILSGSGELSREEFTLAVQKIGASIHVSINNSYVTITLKSTKDATSELLKLFRLMMNSPTFIKSELTRIRTQVKNELIEHSENAAAIAQENFENELYVPEDRRYTNKNSDTIKALNEIQKKALQKMHTQILNTVWTVSIAGDKNTIEKVQESIKLCKQNTKSTQVEPTHSQKKQIQKVVLQNIPSKQNIEFSIGASIPMTLHHPDYLPFVFGLNVLAKWGGFTGRLMSIVREKEGLTYGIYGKTETVEGNEQGHYRISTFFAPNKAVQGLTSTFREIAKIQKDGITQAEYKRFKVILTTQQTLLADSLTRSLDVFHGYMCADFNLHEIEEYKSRLIHVSRTQVNKALRNYLHVDTLIISGAGPVTRVKKDIKNFSK